MADPEKPKKIVNAYGVEVVRRPAGYDGPAVAKAGER